MSFLYFQGYSNAQQGTSYLIPLGRNAALHGFVIRKKTGWCAFDGDYIIETTDIGGRYRLKFDAALRLLGFAQKAADEGYPQMAKMIRAIAAAEEVHGLRALRPLTIIRSTEDNLKFSFESETMVSENAYPSMIQAADEEGNEAARIAFSQVRDIEKLHAKLYKIAIDHMTAEKEPNRPRS